MEISVLYVLTYMFRYMSSDRRYYGENLITTLAQQTLADGFKNIAEP
jgi:hypothetical protein